MTGPSSYGYAIGSGQAGTGTLAITAGSQVVTGTGVNFNTLFTTYPDVGIAYINGVYVSIDSHTATQLAISPASAVTLSGLSWAFYATNYLASLLSVGEPKAEWLEYSKALDLGDGGIRGAGWMATNWNWGFISQADRSALRAFCTTPSAIAVIRTRINDSSDAMRWFIGKMIWPQKESRENAGRRVPFALNIRALRLHD